MCAICGMPMKDGPYNPDGRIDKECATFDHIRPIAFDGKNGCYNLRLTHSECNNKRGCALS